MILRISSRLPITTNEANASLTEIGTKVSSDHPTSLRTEPDRFDRIGSRHGKVTILIDLDFQSPPVESAANVPSAQRRMDHHHGGGRCGDRSGPSSRHNFCGGRAETSIHLDFSFLLRKHQPGTAHRLIRASFSANVTCVGSAWVPGARNPPDSAQFRGNPGFSGRDHLPRARSKSPECGSAAQTTATCRVSLEVSANRVNGRLRTS